MHAYARAQTRRYDSLVLVSLATVALNVMTADSFLAGAVVTRASSTGRRL